MQMFILRWRIFNKDYEDSVYVLVFMRTIIYFDMIFFVSKGYFRVKVFVLFYRFVLYDLTWKNKKNDRACITYVLLDCVLRLTFTDNIVYYLEIFLYSKVR
jgi:hypothetical protein